MPEIFEKMGISFQYPENWQLDETDAVAGRESITVYCPSGGAFWSVTRQPPTADPAELSAAALAAMQQEYAAVESEPVEEELDGVELVGYDLNFFYLDLTNSAMVRSFRADDATLTVFFQGEDREFEEMLPVFRAMTVSLLRGLRGSRHPE